MARTSCFSLLLITLLMLAGCAGGEDDDATVVVASPALEPSPSPTQELAAEPTSTATHTMTPPATEPPVATPEPTALPGTPTPQPVVATPSPEATPEPPATDPVLERFMEAQAEVNFVLSMPTDLAGLTLSGGPLTVSGPPGAPGVTATFSSQPNGAFQVISLMQRAEGVGLEPERPDDETETVYIQGVETVLSLETTSDGTTIYRMAWWMNDVYFSLGATNVDRESVLAFARSLTPLSDVVIE